MIISDAVVALHCIVHLPVLLIPFLWGLFFFTSVQPAMASVDWANFSFRSICLSIFSKQIFVVAAWDIKHATSAACRTSWKENTQYWICKWRSSTNKAINVQMILLAQLLQSYEITQPLKVVVRSTRILTVLRLFVSEVMYETTGNPHST